MFEINSTGHTDWRTLEEAGKRKYIVYLQNELEVADRERRMKAIRSFLYIVQGTVIFLSIGTNIIVVCFY